MSLIAILAVRLLSCINLTIKSVSFLSRAALKGASVAFFSLLHTISESNPNAYISSFVTYLLSLEPGIILVSTVTTKRVGELNLANSPYLSAKR